jgi:hypothetical protein
VDRHPHAAVGDGLGHALGVVHRRDRVDEVPDHPQQGTHDRGPAYEPEQWAPSPEVIGLIPSAAWLSTTLYSGSPHHAVTYDTGRSASSCDHGTLVILRNVLVIHGCHSPFSS